MTIDARRREQYEKFFRETPAIPWREPWPAHCLGASGLACRMCVAMYGLHASEIAKLPQNAQEFEVHLQECHAETNDTDNA
jgi:hypothetical protein